MATSRRNGVVNGEFHFDQNCVFLPKNYFQNSLRLSLTQRFSIMCSKGGGGCNICVLDSEIEIVYVKSNRIDAKKPFY